MERRKIPLGMKILAVLMGLNGILGILALLFLTLGGGFQYLESAGLGNLFSADIFVGAGVFSIAYIIGSVFAFKGDRIGWWIMLLWMVYQTWRPVSSLFFGFGVLAIPGLIVGILLLWYIFSKRKIFNVKLPFIDKSKAE